MSTGATGGATVSGDGESLEWSACAVVFLLVFLKDSAVRGHQLFIRFSAEHDADCGSCLLVQMILTSLLALYHVPRHKYSSL